MHGWRRCALLALSVLGLGYVACDKDSGNDIESGPTAGSAGETSGDPGGGDDAGGDDAGGDDPGGAPSPGEGGTGGGAPGSGGSAGAATGGEAPSSGGTAGTPTLHSGGEGAEAIGDGGNAGAPPVLTGGAGGDVSATGGTGQAGGEPLGAAAGQSGAAPVEASAGNGGASTGGGSGVDDEPPTIVSVTPADGAVGVMPDTSIVITFSEPMDKAATQISYQSPVLPAAAVVFTWNQAGTTLTITPNEPLPYTTTYSGNPEAPATIEFLITTAATDREGNELEEDTAVTFSTARLITMGAYFQRPQDAYVWTAPDRVNDWGDSSILLGDGVTNRPTMLFGWIPLLPLPDDLLMISAASLDVFVRHWDSTDLAPLEVAHVRFTSDDLPDLGAVSVIDDHLAEVPNDVSSYTIDVTPWFLAEYRPEALEDAVLQYRIAFASLSDFDGVAEGLEMNQTPSLTVSYWAP